MVLRSRTEVAAGVGAPDADAAPPRCNTASIHHAPAQIQMQPRPLETNTASIHPPSHPTPPTCTITRLVQMHVCPLLRWLLAAASRAAFSMSTKEGGAGQLRLLHDRMGQWISNIRKMEKSAWHEMPTWHALPVAPRQPPLTGKIHAQAHMHTHHNHHHHRHHHHSHPPHPHPRTL